MAFEETYSKDHEEVIGDVERTHTDFYDQLESARKERCINISRMATRADAGPALISRVKDTSENLTLSTMIRLGLAVGKKLEIRLVDKA